MRDPPLWLPRSAQAPILSQQLVPCFCSRVRCGRGGEWLMRSCGSPGVISRFQFVFGTRSWVRSGYVCPLLSCVSRLCNQWLQFRSASNRRCGAPAQGAVFCILRNALVLEARCGILVFVIAHVVSASSWSSRSCCKGLSRLIYAEFGKRRAALVASLAIGPSRIVHPKVAPAEADYFCSGPYSH